MFSFFRKKKESKEDQKVVPKPQKNFDDTVAKEILAKIKKEFGLDYEKQEYITFRKLERFALKNEIYNFSELASKLDSSATLKEELINMLTVGETYFYREKGHFEIFAKHLESHHVSKVLCAPSSTGEEVYSILLYIFQKGQNVSFEITGIDINSDALQIAKEGCYSKRSVSKLPQSLLERYFAQQDQKYCISDELKRYATFRYQNVFDDSFVNLGKFDIIFCRNMLIYFSDAEKKLLLEKFKTLLNPDGLLFLGHADISFVPDGYIKEHTLNGSYYKKVGF